MVAVLFGSNGPSIGVPESPELVDETLPLRLYYDCKQRKKSSTNHNMQLICIKKLN